MPALHVVHTRSFDAEAAVTWAWPAWQTVCGWHAPPAVENVPDAHDCSPPRPQASNVGNKGKCQETEGSPKDKGEEKHAILLG